MKVLVVHNRYLLPGGEDEAVRSEAAMLERCGHKVILYQRRNDELSGLDPLRKARFVLKDSCRSSRTRDDIQKIIREHAPDLAHVHNTFLMVSPSVYEACAERGVPIVQTLHNYRFLCANGLFLRQGRVCEDCTKEGRKAGVAHRCWKDSLIASWMITRVIGRMEDRGILGRTISHFIALSEFSRQKFIDNGFDAAKVSVKPNFLETDPYTEAPGSRDYALYVGGFFSYKGVANLLKAWEGLRAEFPLKLIGDGPLWESLKSKGNGPGVEFLGRLSLDETLRILRGARFLVFPSECYENFPRVIAEAFACGVPVIASRLGAVKELVRDGQTGLLFQPGDAADLTAKAGYLIRDEARARAMGKKAREEFLEKYTMEKNYQRLMEIYGKVVSTA